MYGLFELFSFQQLPCTQIEASINEVKALFGKHVVINSPLCVSLYISISLLELLEPVMLVGATDEAELEVAPTSQTGTCM